MDCIVHRFAKSQTRLSDFRFISKSAEGCLSYPHPSCELEGQAQSHQPGGAMAVKLMTVMMPGRLGASGMVMTKSLSFN